MAQVVTLNELLFVIERNTLMAKGIGFIDAHLLASAQLSRIPLWTCDRALKLIASELKLAHEYR